VVEQAAFVVVTAMTAAIRDGKVDLESFMRQHKPKVIVYDIAIPYEQNWRLFQHLRKSPASTGVRFVLTTTNVATDAASPMLRGRSVCPACHNCARPGWRNGQTHRT
jgi:CheY-like chemotaxis protein